MIDPLVALGLAEWIIRSIYEPLMEVGIRSH
jgi:hypothetical protein